MMYNVRVMLDEEYDVEADSPEEAFVIASDMAMSVGEWDYEVEEIN